MASSDATSPSGVDLDYKLSEYNAPRRCAHDDCGDGADWYVFADGVISKYVCDEHHDWALDQATPDTDDSESRRKNGGGHWSVE